MANKIIKGSTIDFNQIRLGVIPYGNDRLMSDKSIKFIVADLNGTGLTATQLQDIARRRFGAVRGDSATFRNTIGDGDDRIVDTLRIESVNSLPLTRAILLAYRLAKNFGSRLAGKIAPIVDREDFWKTVEEVEEARDVIAEIKARQKIELRRLERVSLRANVRAMTTEEEEVKTVEGQADSEELTQARTRLSDSIKAEGRLNERLVRELFPALCSFR